MTESNRPSERSRNRILRSKTPSSTKETEIETELLDPPTFQLPNDPNDSDRYELWSVRIPVKFDATLLNGVQLHLSSNLLSSSSNDARPPTTATTPSGQTILTQFECNGTRHALTLGHSSESQSCRILLPHHNQEQKDDDDDEEDEESSSKQQMKPLHKPFQRHVNLVELPPSFLTNDSGDTKNEHGNGTLSPSPNPSLAVVAKSGMRVAYAPIEQKIGLKRRWSAFGSRTTSGIFSNTVQRDDGSSTQKKKKKKKTTE